MPAGIDSPGFVEEEREKPSVTKKIEESDEQISPEKCAEYLIAGMSLLPPYLPTLSTFSFSPV
jgi:3-dehydrosphinganine reductase